MEQDGNFYASFAKEKVGSTVDFIRKFLPISNVSYSFEAIL
jgi:hypothetical protein